MERNTVNPVFKSAYVQSIGTRPAQEDFVFCCDALLSSDVPARSHLGPNAAFYLVADGHGGEQCAQFIAAQLKEKFLQCLAESRGDVGRAMFEAINALDAVFTASVSDE